MNIVQEGGGDGNDQSQLQPPPAQPDKPPPPPPQAQRCPRCDSMNTKFCYYNNYSLSQPRYFCKTCKRYWTHGGSLRNIPIGGGCRKGKRTKTTSSFASSFSSSSSSSAAAAAAIHLMTQQSSQPNPVMTAAATASMGPRGLIGPAVGPTVVPPSYYQGGGYMIHSQNQLSQPLFNLSSMNMVTTTPSSSSNLGHHHPWFNASSSSRSHIPTVFQSDDHNQGGVVETSMNMNMNMNMMMGNSGYAASLNEWSQNDKSLWSTVSTTSIGGNNNSGSPSNNDDQSKDINNCGTKAGGASSSLSGNPWHHLP